MLTPDEQNFFMRVLDFCEENWSAFLQRREEAGIMEAEAELHITSLKGKS